MTKREAKRRACLAAAKILENDIDSDARWLREPENADTTRLLDAVRELVDELYRRGGR